MLEPVANGPKQGISFTSITCSRTKFSGHSCDTYRLCLLNSAHVNSGPSWQILGGLMYKVTKE